MNEINFSALPKQTTNVSQWKTIVLSIKLAFLAFLVVGTTTFVSESNQETGESLKVILMLLVSIVVLFGAYRVLKGKIRKQSTAMNKFAQQNGWQFEGYQKHKDNSLLPANWGFESPECDQIYRVTGTIAGNNFDLYALDGFVGMKYPSYYGRSTLGYRTAVRTKAPCNTNALPSNIQAVNEGGWNYVLMNGNAISATEIQAILEPLVTSA